MNGNVIPITNPPSPPNPLNYRVIGWVIALIFTLIGVLYNIMNNRLEASSSQAIANKEDIRNLTTVVTLKMEGMDKALHEIKTNQSQNHTSTNKRLDELMRHIISYNERGNRIGHTQ